MANSERLQQEFEEWLMALSVERSVLLLARGARNVGIDDYDPYDPDAEDYLEPEEIDALHGEVDQLLREAFVRDAIHSLMNKGIMKASATLDGDLEYGFTPEGEEIAAYLNEHKEEL